MDEELEFVIRLAKRAGELVSRVFGREFEVVEKADDQGPVTIADHEADELIRGRLAAAFPGDGILTEETPDDLSRLHRERLWLVDPLDGTRQFVEGIAEFAVMIGLAVGGRPMLGVVHLPEEGLTYAGRVGEGAFEEKQGGDARRSLRLTPWEDRAPGPVVALSRFNASSRTRRAADGLSPARVVQSGSVGRKAMLVAAGAADVYVSLGGRSRHWDACAPEAIVTAAGGVFVDARGRRLHYNTPQTRNEHGLLVCRPGLESAATRAAAAARRPRRA
jgi:3'(2'), 5'-bisphosphate nucleotidase